MAQLWPAWWPITIRDKSMMSLRQIMAKALGIPPHSTPNQGPRPSSAQPTPTDQRQQWIHAKATQDRYDRMIRGNDLTSHNGLPFLNGLDIQKLLILHQFSPTVKSERFLEGLLARLEAYRRDGGAGHLDNEGRLVDKVIDDVQHALETTPRPYRLAVGV